MIQSITAKLGNMRKAAEFTLYPGDDPTAIIIQSDKRIAQINVETGEGVLSSGMGGHPGFHALSKFLGATEITVSKELCEELKSKQAEYEIQPGGGIRIL